jgi:hypothetical protein
LRARYYSPIVGMFTTKDPSQWETNPYQYALSNPVMYIDPTGYIAEGGEAHEANIIVNNLLSYGVSIKVDWGPKYLRYWFNDPVDSNKSGIRTSCSWIPGRWSLNELYIMEGAVQNLDTAMKNRMSQLIGPVSISKVPNACGRGCTNGQHIDLSDSGYLPIQSPNGNLTKYYIASEVNGTPKTNFDQWTVVHELGHVWDAKNNPRLSWKLIWATGGGFGTLECDPNGRLPGCNHWLYHYGGTPPKGSDYNFDWQEDFAESVAAYVFPDEAHQSLMNMLNNIRISARGYEAESQWYPTLFQQLYYADYRTTTRWQFIDDKISGK